jgi:hypothetical protein
MINLEKEGREDFPLGFFSSLILHHGFSFISFSLNALLAGASHDEIHPDRLILENVVAYQVG